MKEQLEKAINPVKLKLGKKTVLKLNTKGSVLNAKEGATANNFIFTLDCGGDSYVKRCITIIN